MEDRQRMFLKDIKLQPDGRFSFWYHDENGNDKKIKDGAICCNFNLVETQDSYFIEAYFEVVKK